MPSKLIDIDDLINREVAAQDALNQLKREERRYREDVELYLIECGYTNDYIWTRDSDQVAGISLVSSKGDRPAYFLATILNEDLGKHEGEYVDVLPEDLLRTKEERAAMKATRDAVRKEVLSQRKKVQDQEEFDEYLRLKAKYEVAP